MMLHVVEWVILAKLLPEEKRRLPVPVAQGRLLTRKPTQTSTHASPKHSRRRHNYVDLVNARDLKGR